MIDFLLGLALGGVVAASLALFFLFLFFADWMARGSH